MRTFEAVEALEVREDPARGLFLAVCIDDTRLGPAIGGIRRHRYPSRDAALVDVVALARAMTRKCAVAGLAAGGGKAVVLDVPNLPRDDAYRAMGELVESLGGRFFTGPDVGTTSDDLAVVATRTSRVADGHAIEAGERTAQGVAAGIRAVLARLSCEIGDATVVVQGVGGVGAPLARRLAAAGARVVVCDADPRRAEAVAAATGARVIDADVALDEPCDVFAPCALGAVVDDSTIPRLRCRAIAGAANNVLAQPRHGRALFDAGVLYAPDYVVNAGALIVGVSRQFEGMRGDDPRLDARVDAIGERIGVLLDRSRRERIPPEVLAEELAQSRLAAAGGKR